MGGRLVPAHAEALPLILAPLAKKGKWGAKALRKTDVAQAPRSASSRGRRWKSVKAMADLALVNVGAGTSDELPLVLRRSFKDGWYSPTIGMEEIESQIMLAQFVASGVIVKGKIIDIDSDWFSHFAWCLRFLEYSITFVVTTHSNSLLCGGGVRLIREFRNSCLWLCSKMKSVTLAFKR
jgi:hypothetical protein